MTNKYKIILILLVILFIIFGRGIFKKKETQQAKSEKFVAKRTFVNAELEKEGNVPLNTARVDYTTNSLFLLHNSSVTQINANTFQTIHEFEDKSIYNIFNLKDTLILYNRNAHSLIYYYDYKKTKEIMLPNNKTNVCYVGDKIFYDTKYNNNKSLKTYSIRAIDTTIFKFNIYQLIDTLIDNTDSFCKSCYMEGRIFSIDNKNILYYSYKLSDLYVIDVESKQVKTIKTIEEQKRVNVKSIKTELGKSMMISCEHEEGPEYLHVTCALNDKYLFIEASSDMEYKDVVYTVMDVYDKKTFSYLKSVRCKLSNSGSEYMLDAKANNDYLFIVSSSNKLYRFKLPQL